MASMPSRLRRGIRRLREFERQELVKFLRWLESTQNFVHVSLLLFVPLVIALLTFLSNTVDLLPFLLFPPLASGSYTLFAHPKSPYSTPLRFVGGTTAGAVCGWIALAVAAQVWPETQGGAFRVQPGAAAFGILLTGLVTWATRLEEPQAYSTALLVLVTGIGQFVYVVSIFVSSLLVAGIFLVWRRELYDQRAEYLYDTLDEDDDVLVPVRGDVDEGTAALGAQLAASSDEGKLVLLSVLESESVEQADDDLPEEAQAVADRLEQRGADLEAQFGVPCEVVVLRGNPDDASTVTATARDANCDLVVAPYESTGDRLSGFLRDLFTSSLDVVVVRTSGDQTEWRRILVPVRSPSDIAHAMLDFAGRLAGDQGTVSVCHATERKERLRQAESMLADLVDTFDRSVETRVAVAPIETFLESHAPNYDLTVVGSSTDRSVASRFINTPTFRKLDSLDCDLAIVHRGQTGQQE